MALGAIQGVKALSARADAAESAIVILRLVATTLALARSFYGGSVSPHLVRSQKRIATKLYLAGSA